MKNRSFVSLALVLAATLSQAKAFVLPHVLERSGVIIGVGFNPTGGQPRIDQYGQASGRTPLSLDFSLEGSYPVFKEIEYSRRKGENKLVLDLHRLAGGGGGIAGGLGGLMTVLQPGIPTVSTPECDVNSNEPGTFGVTFEGYDVSSGGYVAITKGEKDAVKEQKKWSPANFKLEIAGLDAKRVTKVSSFTIKQGIAADGSTGLQLSDVNLTVDPTGAADFFAWFKSAGQGKPVEKDMTLTYFSNSGEPLFSVSSTVQITSCGFFDIFTELGLDASSSCQVTMRHKELTGHVTLIK